MWLRERNFPRATLRKFTASWRNPTHRSLSSSLGTLAVWPTISSGNIRYYSILPQFVFISVCSQCKELNWTGPTGGLIVSYRSEATYRTDVGAQFDWIEGQLVCTEFVTAWQSIYRVAQKVVTLLMKSVSFYLERFRRYGVLKNVRHYGPPCTCVRVYVYSPLCHLNWQSRKPIPTSVAIASLSV